MPDFEFSHMQPQAGYIAPGQKRDRSQRIARKIVADALTGCVSLDHIARGCLPRLPSARLELLSKLIQRILADRKNSSEEWILTNQANQNIIGE